MGVDLIAREDLVYLHRVLPSRAASLLHSHAQPAPGGSILFRKQLAEMERGVVSQ